jgi:hypothetical protein
MEVRRWRDGAGAAGSLGQKITERVERPRGEHMARRQAAARLRVRRRGYVSGGALHPVTAASAHVDRAKMILAPRRLPEGGPTRGLRPGADRAWAAGRAFGEGHRPPRPARATIGAAIEVRKPPPATSARATGWSPGELTASA